MILNSSRRSSLHRSYDAKTLAILKGYAKFTGIERQLSTQFLTAIPGLCHVAHHRPTNRYPYAILFPRTLTRLKTAHM